MKMPVIRSADGVVINIGPWDYQISMRQKVDPETGMPVFHLIGPSEGIPVMEQYAANPLPPGSVESEAEIEIAPDGGLRAVK